MKRDDGVGGRKKYEAPTPIFLNRHSSKIPETQTLGRRNQQTPAGNRATVEFRMVLDLDGRFQEVSEEFLELTGYTREELLGKRVDQITAPYTADVPQHIGAVIHFGHFHCLWMFVLREGRAILVRSDWALLPDLSMEVRCGMIPANA